MSKIYLFSDSDLSILRQAIEIHKNIENQVKSFLVEGSSPFEVNKYVESLCKKHRVRAAFYGQLNQFNMPFPAHCCVLVNQEIVHNIPFSKKQFNNGDLVKFDFGIHYKEFYTDFGFSLFIGNNEDQRKKNLLDTVNRSVFMACSIIKHGIRSGDISEIIQLETQKGGFLPVRMFCGHGIGKSLHLDPQIPFWGSKNTGDLLRQNMVVCVENWIAEKNNEISLESDCWTYRLSDGGFSAFKESMILVKHDTFENLTD